MYMKYWKSVKKHIIITEKFYIAVYMCYWIIIIVAVTWFEPS